MIEQTTKKEIRDADSTRSNPPATQEHWANLRTVWIAAAVVLLVALLSSLTAIGIWSPAVTAEANPQSDADTIRRMPVRAVRVELVDHISQKREYTGVIRAKQQADLGFELTGRVADVSHDEGDVVAAGEILAHLDIRALEARRSATSASLAQATAVLDELKAGPRQESIASMRAQLAEANSSLKLAELNFERRRKLRESNSISTEEFQQAFYSFQSARSQADSTQKQLDELEAGTRPERVAAQQAASEQLKAALSEIAVQIEKSSIVAPFAGKIVERMADPGGIVTPSQPILKLVETENFEAVVGLPAQVATSLKTGDPVSISVAGKTFRANVLAKIQQLEMATRTQNVILQLQPSADGQILPGQLCQIEIAHDVRAEGFWVPASSLTNGIRGLWSVMVAEELSGRAIRKDVEIVYTDGDQALVRGTLEEGAMVIVEGTHRIVEGQAIEVLADSFESIAAEQQP